MTKKMIFFGAYHPANDARLASMMADAIQKQFSDVRCLYLGVDSQRIGSLPATVFDVLSLPKNLSERSDVFSRKNVAYLVEHIQQFNVDLVQVSDAGELVYGAAIKLAATCPVIYDSHEDYFRQRYEYDNKSVQGFVKGAWLRLEELIHVKKMDAVFCTDPFLQGLYSLPIFGAESVHLVRNCPVAPSEKTASIKNVTDTLKLVYVGSVTPHRGITDTALFVQRFNAESSGSPKLEFHVYGRENAHVKQLLKDRLITYCGLVPHSEVRSVLQKYDIGICLLRNALKKYERNIPIKNFEYMAAGLPFVTSDLGEMRRYADLSEAGIAIDPTSYNAFKNAIHYYIDPVHRQQHGDNGIVFARQHLSREKELEPYLNTVQRLLHL